MNTMRTLLAITGLLGGAAATLTVACAEDTAPPNATSDAASEASATTDGSNIVDAGDPDARGAFDPADVPVVCDASPCATQLVAGGGHFCVRVNDGTVRCWGDDAFGATGTTPEGDGGAGGVHVIPNLAGVTQLSAAGATTCARLDDGTVACWGDNRGGLLGLAEDPAVTDSDPHPSPEKVALSAPASRVDVGHGSASALLATGALWCWGKDDQSQLARGTGGDAGLLTPENPVRGPGLAAIAPLSVKRTVGGSFTTLGITLGGELWSWGAVAGNFGILSGRVASVSPTATPRRITSLGRVTSVAASTLVEIPYDPPPVDPHEPPPPFDPPPPRAHACALVDGEVYCWGRSYTGALCTGLPDKEQEPRHAPIDAKTWPQQLAAADEITCARMTNGSVYCCGSDTRGRLGTGTVGVLSSVFTRANGFSGFAVQVATSDHAVCALLRDGSVECWGSNEKGALGKTPDDAPHPSAVKVAF